MRNFDWSVVPGYTISLITFQKFSVSRRCSIIYLEERSWSEHISFYFFKRIFLFLLLYLLHILIDWKMNKSEQDIMIRQTIVNRKVKFIFTLCGIWPGISCVLFYRMFWIITMTIAISYLLSYLLAHIYTAELMDLIDCLCLMLAHIKVISKCFIFWLNQK